MNAIDFECPTCGAKAGERCHTLTGKATPVSHPKRKQAALDQERSREESQEEAAPGFAEAIKKN